MDRAPGLSVRLKLTLSYASFVLLAGALLLGAVWLFLLRYVPRGETVIVHHQQVLIRPGRGDLLRHFAPAAAILVAFLVVFGLLGGWLLAGRMLAPLTRITDATRTATTGSLSHRIRLPGRRDEFRELADAFDAMLARLETQIAEQQRFAANASHELRTPLAITQTLLDVARKDPNRRHRRTRRPPPRCQHPSDRPHRSIAPTQPRRPEVLHPRTRRSVPRCRRSHRNAPPLAERHGVSIETSGDMAAHRRFTRSPAAVDYEPRAQRDRPQSARTWHRVGHDQRPPEECGAHCREHRREARSAVSFHACRAFSARHRTHTHRQRRCRPRPGNRQKHHPSSRRNPHPRPPSRWRALRHGATTRRATGR